MNATSFANKLSWIDIGNRDEAQRKKFVAELNDWRNQIIQEAHMAALKSRNGSEAASNILKLISK